MNLNLGLFTFIKRKHTKKIPKKNSKMEVATDTHIKTSPIRMSFKNTIRAEGSKANPSTAHTIGFNYIMAHMGDFDDFKKGHIVIRRKQAKSRSVTYDDLIEMGITDDSDIKKMFDKCFKRTFILSTGADPTDENKQDAWLVFNSGNSKIKLIPEHNGGPVTYDYLHSVEHKSDDEIEKIFNDCRRKSDHMKGGSLRYKIYSKFMNMVSNWESLTYNSAGAADKFTPDLEKWSTSRRPQARTSFCSLVGRMMTLVRAKHMQDMINKRHDTAKQRRTEQLIAWNKQSIKRETFKDKIGTDAFNAKKHRDKAASTVLKAEKVSGNLSRVTKFVEFRGTEHGKKWDNVMSPDTTLYPKHDSVKYGTKTVSLGFTNFENMASFIKRNIRKLSNMTISWVTDPGDIGTVLFQYVAIRGEGALPLSNTNDIVSGENIEFRISKYYFHNNRLFVNPNNMSLSVFRSLPKEWKDFEGWSGHGIVGNPQKSIRCVKLIEITPTNICKFSFSKDGTPYTIGLTRSSMAKSVADLENGIVDKYVAAAKAAKCAEEERKKEVARLARAAEANRRKFSGGYNGYDEEAARNATPFSTNRVFNQFFGGDPNADTKKLLAARLAKGEIDTMTYKMAMEALK